MADKKKLKSFDIHVRLTKEERAEIERRALLEKMKPAPYVKRAALLFPIQEQPAT